MTDERLLGLLAQTAGPDPLVALRALASVRKEIESREAVLVRRARNRGASWSAIALVLDVSRHALHRKYGGGWRQQEQAVPEV